MSDTIWSDIGPTLQADVFPIVRTDGPTATLYRTSGATTASVGTVAVNVARGDPSRFQQSAAGVPVWGAAWVANCDPSVDLRLNDVLVFETGRAYQLTGPLETDTGTGLAPCVRVPVPREAA